MNESILAQGNLMERRKGQCDQETKAAAAASSNQGKDVPAAEVAKSREDSWEGAASSYTTGTNVSLAIKAPSGLAWLE